MSFESDSSDTEGDITQEPGINNSTIYKQEPPGVNNDQKGVVSPNVNHDNKMGVISPTSNSNVKYYCHNEDHQTALPFDSAAEKRYHILRTHKCVAHGCHYHAEHNSTLAEHYEKIHTQNAKFTCNLCGATDDDKISHYQNYHFKCNSCQEWFKEHLDLKTHEIQCQNAVPNEDKKESNALQFVSASKENHSLYWDKSPVDIQLGETLCKMFQSLSLSQEEKDEGIRHIQQYQAQNMIAKARKRRGENTRLCSDLLFPIPTFYKPGESNSNTKSLFQFLKNCSVFDGDVEMSEANSWQNYEDLADIFSSISTVTTVCKLSESVAVALLDTLLSQQVKDSVIAYKQCEITDLSYSAAVKALQFLFVPLNLEKIEKICMGSNKSATQSMFDYAAKLHKALDLCSQRLNSEDRPAYIENHMRRQIFINLPVKIKTEVEKKQSIFTPFSSTELLDFCLAERQATSSTYETQYQSLYNVRESENSENNDVSSSVHSESEDDQPPPVSVIRRSDNVDPEIKHRLTVLHSWDPKYQIGIWCLFCLKPHHHYKVCRQYSGLQLSTNLHVIMNMACGWHRSSDCLRKCDETHSEDKFEKAPHMYANFCRHYDSNDSDSE